jgi:hypothetical protein
MNNLKAGVAWALVGSILVAPLGAAGQSKGYLSGDARSETKQPYADYSVRARSVTDGTVQGTTILDAQGNFLLEGLAAGKFMVELTRTGQNKVICSEGPFEIKPGATADTPFGRGEIGIKCNQPVAAWLLLAGAAAAGVTAGVVATGDPASPSR